MEETKHYILKDNINKNIALELYKIKIQEDLRFAGEVNESLLTIEERYNSYYFFDCSIHNHAYFYNNKITNESIDGKIDIQLSYSDKDFILNELPKRSAAEAPGFEEKLLDDKKYDKVFKELIQNVKDKALSIITLKHNVKPSRYIHIDIGPLEGFHILNCEIYYEKVYIFRYRNEQKKKDFVSILSGYSQTFYQLEFVYSPEYIEFLTKYKRPIEYIPKEYLPYYYIDSFAVYHRVNKKLEFESSKGILKKIRDNISYENYSLYNDYLKSGIYYFRIHKYLKKLKIEQKPLRYHIYLAYLTLKYQKESGFFLYECSCLGILPKNDIPEKIRFLEASYRLGNLEAKKVLYEHYSMPLYFNSNMVKKYS